MPITMSGAGKRYLQLDLNDVTFDPFSRSICDDDDEFETNAQQHTEEPKALHKTRSADLSYRISERQWNCNEDKNPIFKSTLSLSDCAQSRETFKTKTSDYALSTEQIPTQDLIKSSSCVHETEPHLKSESVPNNERNKKAPISSQNVTAIREKRVVRTVRKKVRKRNYASKGNANLTGTDPNEDIFYKMANFYKRKSPVSDAPIDAESGEIRDQPYTALKSPHSQSDSPAKMDIKFTIGDEDNSINTTITSSSGDGNLVMKRSEEEKAEMAISSKAVLNMDTSIGMESGPFPGLSVTRGSDTPSLRDIGIIKSLSIEKDSDTLLVPDRGAEKRDSISKWRDELLLMKSPTVFGRSERNAPARKPPPDLNFPKPLKRPPLIKYCESNRSIDETVDTEKISLLNMAGGSGSESDNSPLSDVSIPDSPNLDSGHLLWKCYQKWSNEESSKEESNDGGSRGGSNDGESRGGSKDEAREDGSEEPCGDDTGCCHSKSADKYNQGSQSEDKHQAKEESDSGSKQDCDESHTDGYKDINIPRENRETDIGLNRACETDTSDKNESSQGDKDVLKGVSQDRCCEESLCPKSSNRDNASYSDAKTVHKNTALKTAPQSDVATVSLSDCFEGEPKSEMGSDCPSVNDISPVCSGVDMRKTDKGAGSSTTLSLHSHGGASSYLQSSTTVSSLPHHCNADSYSPGPPLEQCLNTVALSDTQFNPNINVIKNKDTETSQNMSCCPEDNSTESTESASQMAAQYSADYSDKSKNPTTPLVNLQAISNQPVAQIDAQCGQGQCRDSPNQAARISIQLSAEGDNGYNEHRNMKESSARTDSGEGHSFDDDTDAGSDTETSSAHLLGASCDVTDVSFLALRRLTTVMEEEDLPERQISTSNTGIDPGHKPLPLVQASPAFMDRPDAQVFIPKTGNDPGIHGVLLPHGSLTHEDYGAISIASHNDTKPAKQTSQQSHCADIEERSKEPSSGVPCDDNNRLPQEGSHSGFHQDSCIPFNDELKGSPVKQVCTNSYSYVEPFCGNTEPLNLFKGKTHVLSKNAEAFDTFKGRQNAFSKEQYNVPPKYDHSLCDCNEEHCKFVDRKTCAYEQFRDNLSELKKAVITENGCVHHDDVTIEAPMTMFPNENRPIHRDLQRHCMQTLYMTSITRENDDHETKTVAAQDITLEQGNIAIGNPPWRNPMLDSLITTCAYEYSNRLPQATISSISDLRQGSQSLHNDAKAALISETECVNRHCAEKTGNVLKDAGLCAEVGDKYSTYRAVLDGSSHILMKDVEEYVFVVMCKAIAHEIALQIIRDALEKIKQDISDIAQVHHDSNQSALVQYTHDVNHVVNGVGKNIPFDKNSIPSISTQSVSDLRVNRILQNHTKPTRTDKESIFTGAKADIGAQAKCGVIDSCDRRDSGIGDTGGDMTSCEDRCPVTPAPQPYDCAAQHRNVSSIKEHNCGDNSSHHDSRTLRISSESNSNDSLVEENLETDQSQISFAEISAKVSRFTADPNKLPYSCGQTGISGCSVNSNQQENPVLSVKRRASSFSEEEIWGTPPKNWGANDGLLQDNTHDMSASFELKKSSMTLPITAITTQYKSPFDDDFDPFGDVPCFGEGEDPFAVQSPDPFDCNPFTVDAQKINAQPPVHFRNSLRSISNSSLYKILEEDGMDEDRDHTLETGSENRNDKSHEKTNDLISFDDDKELIDMTKIGTGLSNEGKVNATVSMASSNRPEPNVPWCDKNSHKHVDSSLGGINVEKTMTNRTSPREIVECNNTSHGTSVPHATNAPQNTANYLQNRGKYTPTQNTSQTQCESNNEIDFKSRATCIVKDVLLNIANHPGVIKVPEEITSPDAPKEIMDFYNIVNNESGTINHSSNEMDKDTDDISIRDKSSAHCAHEIRNPQEISGDAVATGNQCMDKVIHESNSTDTACHKNHKMTRLGPKLKQGNLDEDLDKLIEEFVETIIRNAFQQMRDVDYLDKLHTKRVDTGYFCPRNEYRNNASLETGVDTKPTDTKCKESNERALEVEVTASPDDALFKDNNECIRDGKEQVKSPLLRRKSVRFSICEELIEDIPYDASDYDATDELFTEQDESYCDVIEESDEELCDVDAVARELVSRVLTEAITHCQQHQVYCPGHQRNIDTPTSEDGEESKHSRTNPDTIFNKRKKMTRDDDWLERAAAAVGDQSESGVAAEEQEIAVAAQNLDDQHSENGVQLALQAYISQIATDFVANVLAAAFNDPRLTAALEQPSEQCACKSHVSEVKAEAGAAVTAGLTEERRTYTGASHRAANNDATQSDVSGELHGGDDNDSVLTGVPEAAAALHHIRHGHLHAADCRHNMQADNNAAISNSCFSLINTSAGHSQPIQAHSQKSKPALPSRVVNKTRSGSRVHFSDGFTSEDMETESEAALNMDGSNTDSESQFSSSNPFSHNNAMNSPDSEVAGIFSGSPSGLSGSAQPRVDITIDECSSNSDDDGIVRKSRAPRIIVDECSSYASSSDEERVVVFPKVDIQIDECSSNAFSSEEDIYRLQQVSNDLETASNRSSVRNRDMSSNDSSSSSDEEGEYIIEPRFREFSDPRFREIERFGRIASDVPASTYGSDLYSIGEDDREKVSAKNLKNTAVHGFVDIVIDECASNPASPDCDPTQASSSNTRQPDVVIHECPSNADSGEEDMRVSFAPRSVAITVDECSSNAQSSDDDEVSAYVSDTQVAGSRSQQPCSGDLGEGEGCNPLDGHNDLDLSEEVLDGVNAFVSDVIQSAVIQYQKAKAEMTHIKEEAPMRPKSSATNPSRVEDDYFTEEIKQMRDQIPEELAESAHAQMDNRPTSGHVAFSSHTHTDNAHGDLDISDIHDQRLNQNSDLNLNSSDLYRSDLNRNSSDLNRSDLNASDLNSNSDLTWNSSRGVSDSFGVTGSMDTRHAYESFETALNASPDVSVLSCGTSESRGAFESTRLDEPLSPVRPTSLATGPKKLINPNMDAIDNSSFDLELTAGSRSRSSSTSTEGCDSTFDLSAKTPDSFTTMDAMEGAGLAWTPEKPPPEKIPEYTAEEEMEDTRHWRTVTVAGAQYKIDIKVIEPYKQVLSHGGYYGDGFNAMIVFSACHLPDRRRRDYQYVMDNLFLYLLSTLELLVVEDYMLIYFHGATPTHKVPPLRWLRRCQQAIDRRLKKNLKQLLVVHPTLWLKTVILMTKPFVSSKFYDKVVYVPSLQRLADLVPTEYIFVAKPIQQYDDARFKNCSNPTTPS